MGGTVVPLLETVAWAKAWKSAANGGKSAHHVRRGNILSNLALETTRESETSDLIGRLAIHIIHAQYRTDVLFGFLPNHPECANFASILRQVIFGAISTQNFYVC